MEMPPVPEVPASGGTPLRHEAVRKAEWLLSLPACVTLFGMMMLTVVDVAGRYLFAAPLRPAFELTEISLALLIFCGIPVVSLHGSHVVCDLVDPMLPPVGARVLRKAADFVSGCAVGGLAMLLWGRAASIAESGDRTPVAAIQLAPLVYAMAALLVLTSVVHLLRAWPGFSDLPAATEAPHA
jgi:TRAP-type transport system small permease protein